MEDLIIWRRISLFNQLYWFAKKISGKSTRNVESITSNNVEVGDVQDIELQSLGNNNASFSGSNNILVRGLFEEHSASCILPHELNSMNAKVPHMMRCEFVVSS